MYRLLTEERENLPDIVGRYVDGFTLSTGLGMWKDKLERSAKIDLDAPIATVRQIAEAIKRDNGQDAVMILELGRSVLI